MTMDHQTDNGRSCRLSYRDQNIAGLLRSPQLPPHPQDVVTNLQTFARHYGEVVHVIPLLTLGRVVTKAAELESAEMGANEIAAVVQRLQRS